ncbi:MAG TPA: glycosyltransferase, partial [Arcobacter sp.]|nr:glycosyltransferase [Arcobacter sp.]
MNILMYSNSFGGHTSTFIKQDVEHLSKKHNLLYICNTVHNASTDSYDNLKIVNEESLTLLQRVFWKFDVNLNYSNYSLKNKITTIINEFKPDLIHCQFGIEALRLIDNLENKSIPVIIQFRGYDASKMLKKRSYVKRLQELLSRDNYYSIFVSDSLKQNLKKRSINVKNSIILHSGINLTKFHKQNYTTTHQYFTFLQVSSLVEKKGHEYTLQAFAKFLSSQNSKNFKLVLTGDGERKSLLLDLVHKLNIQDHVEFVGFVSPKQAKELMQNADVFVHHSITPQSGDEEGIPNAIMEAMAMELPIISTYHAGIPELVTDGVNGYLVEERDVDMYAKRMSDIISWGKIPINRKVIEEEFEINIHIQK